MGDWAEKQRLREAVIDAVKREDINSVRSFLNDGADINVCEGGYLAKKNLLMMAIDRRNIDISLLLVERGIDLNFSRTIEKEEKTAFDLAKDKKLNEVTDAIERKSSANEDLMRAISIGVTELAVHALDAGADINLIVNEGKEHGGTLLMIAICMEQRDIAKLLISRGINLDFVNKWDDPSSGEHFEDTAYDLARKMNYLDVIECMEQQRNKNKQNNDSSHSNGLPTQQQNVKSSDVIEDVGDFDYEEKVVEEVNSREKKNKKKSQKNSSSCVIV